MLEDRVMSDYDLCSIIWSYLDVPTIGGLASLSKTSYRLYKETYPVRLHNEYIVPANRLFSMFSRKTTPLLRTLPELVTNDILVSLVTEVVTLLTRFVNGRLWIALVNDIDLMEVMFYALAYIEKDLVCLKTTQVYQVFDSAIYYEAVALLDNIDSFLYVEYPDKFNIHDLKSLARFKKIKKYYKKNRSQLIRALRRPSDELYFCRTSSYT